MIRAHSRSRASVCLHVQAHSVDIVRSVFHAHLILHAHTHTYTDTHTRAHTHTNAPSRHRGEDTQSILRRLSSEFLSFWRALPARGWAVSPLQLASSPWRCEWPVELTAAADDRHDDADADPCAHRYPTDAYGVGVDLNRAVESGRFKQRLRVVGTGLTSRSATDDRDHERDASSPISFLSPGPPHPRRSARSRTTASRERNGVNPRSRS